MTLMLGIDTGGTYTDAVLVDPAPGSSEAAAVVAAAKAPTTHHDLTVGVAAAVRRVLAAAGPGAASAIGLVSVSTTLATNALVEGHGEPAGLLTFGFSNAELQRIGIGAAVDPDLMITFDGGHDAHGQERAGFDESAIAAGARSLAPRVSAFAVAAQFSVRNPDHERRAAEIIRASTGKPVTSSHELSARLDGPRRALTAALNARLIATIDRLNAAVRSVLVDQSIDAPLMVVRGDGSLVSADFAASRPIETVLSGPAASVVGALYLGDLHDGLVADIGGTTTDVAVISGGRPKVTSDGATVGGHRTMVEAVEMATIGLGGDSEVHIDARAADGPIRLGPGRAIPLGRLAIAHPEIHAALDRQLAAPVGQAGHGRFLVSTAAPGLALADAREAEVLDRLRSGPLAPGAVAPNGLAQRAVSRLQARGLVRMATFTPTDAAALLGLVDPSGRGDDIDATASRKAAALVARQSGLRGSAVAADGAELAERVVELLVRRSAEFVVRVALAADGVELRAREPLLDASLERRGGRSGAASVAIGLHDPITAVGAPAGAYYGRVGALTGTTATIPRFAEVANAVGAVVGRVRVRQRATITQPTRGQFRVHLDDQPTFGSVDRARAEATRRLESAATAQAHAAGADTPELVSSWHASTATVEGKEIFVEGTVTVEASGRPRF